MKALALLALVCLSFGLALADDSDYVDAVLIEDDLTPRSLPTSASKFEAQLKSFEDSSVKKGKNGQPFNIRVGVFAVNPNTLADAKELLIEIQGNKVHCTNGHIRKNKGSFSWKGRADGGGPASCTLTVRGHAITGSVVAGKTGEKYLLSSVGMDGAEIVVRVGKVNVAALEGMQKEKVRHKKKKHNAVKARAKDVAKARFASAPVQPVKIFNAYSQEALAFLKGDLELLTARINEGFRFFEESVEASGLKDRVIVKQVGSLYKAKNAQPILEVENCVDRLGNPADMTFDDVRTAAEAAGADVIMFIVNGTDACGMAQEIGATIRMDAVAATDVSCLQLGSYAHELAHIYGCDHNKESFSGDLGRNHGYIAASKKWRTVMAYPSGTESVRVRRFSSPTVKYEGEVGGISNQADCVARLPVGQKVLSKLNKQLYERN